jgi:hypothetical protein
MASAELSRRVEKVVDYPPLSEMGDLQRREFHEALLEADSFEDLPGKWQAAILTAEPRVVDRALAGPAGRTTGRDHGDRAERISPSRSSASCRPSSDWLVQRRK